MFSMWWPHLCLISSLILVECASEVLEGRNLSVSYSGPFPHIIPRRGGERTGGASIQVLDILSEKFQFQFTLKAEIGFDPVVNKDNSSVGVIASLMDGRADLGVGQMSMTLDRSLLIDFLTPMSSYQLVFAYLKPGPVDSLLTLLRPFDLPIWQGLMLSIALIFTFLTLHDVLLFWGHNNRAKGSAFERSALSFALPLQESVPSHWIFREGKGSKMQLRLYAIILWLMTSLVLSLAYKSIMLAMLTSVEYEDPVDSAQDILDRQLMLTVNSATTMHSVLANSRRPVFQRLYKEAVVERNGLFINEPGNVIPQRIAEARESGAAALTSNRQNVEALDIFHVAKDDIIMNTHTSWAVRQGSPLASIFNPAIKALRESGIMAKFENDHVQRVARTNKIDRLRQLRSDGATSSKDKPLTFRQCQPMFLMHVMGLILALTIFGLEKKSCNKRKVEKRKIRQRNKKLGFLP